MGIFPVAGSLCPSRRRLLCDDSTRAHRGPPLPTVLALVRLKPPGREVRLKFHIEKDPSDPDGPGNDSVVVVSTGGVVLEPLRLVRLRAPRQPPLPGIVRVLPAYEAPTVFCLVLNGTRLTRFSDGALKARGRPLSAGETAPADTGVKPAVPFLLLNCCRGPC